MIEINDEDLGRDLCGMTEWKGTALGLWKRALSAAPMRGGRFAVMNRAGVRSAIWILATAAAVLLIVFVPSQMMRLTAKRGANAGLELSKQTANYGHSSPLPAASKLSEQDFAMSRLLVDSNQLKSLGYVGESREGRVGLPRDARFFFDTTGASTPGGFLSPNAGNVEDQARNEPDAQRQVIRKATMELVTPDVRAAFLKAVHLISEAGGEYVQESSVTGTGRDTQANLTLRIAAGRISAVLNELRDLGEVRSENQGGEDVTAQVVDLEARMRNEQRVEKELLELFDTRKDAPLKEILELRDKLSDVRRNIEQLVAGRERLGRLVSLASVLVIIRTKDAPAEAAERGIWDYFTQSCAKAWNRGLQVLSDTVAGLVNIAVGGAVWWVVLVVAVVLIRRRMRRV